MTRYTAEDRRNVADLVAHGVPPHQIAAQLGIPYATVYRWLHPDYAERVRVASRRAKQRRKGSCAVCGRPTSYAGHGTTVVSRLCQSCAHDEQMTPRWAIEWLTHLYVDLRLSTYAIGARLGLRDSGSIYEILRQHGCPMRSRSEAQRGSKKPRISQRNREREPRPPKPRTPRKSGAQKPPPPPIETTPMMDGWC